MHVHAADIQDRDGGLLVMATLFGLYPFMKKLFGRRRLPGTEIQGWPDARLRAGQRRDRQALGRGQVRHPAQTMGRRANYRLAQSVPPFGQGLGTPKP
jgi:hypothetical protein